MKPAQPISTSRRELLLGVGLASLTASPKGLAASLARVQVRPADVPKNPPSPIRVRVLAQDLHHPWAVAPLPNGEYLVTERRGRLIRVGLNGIKTPVGGTPQVYNQGQGGLLDCILSPNFAADLTIFLSYAEPSPNGARTAVYRAELRGNRLVSGQRIFAQADDYGGGFHFGSRLAADQNNHLFVTTGDRYHHRDRAQELGSHLGKIIRVHPDGRIPADNPFVSQSGALAEIFSLGHRNLQGLSLDPETGRLIAHEHGPQGGDELNRIRAGGNYGWPLVTFGTEYGSGAPIGEGSHRPDMVDPLYVWVPSIAPSGLAIVSNASAHPWAGSHLIGALRARCLVRLAQSPSGQLIETRYSLPGNPRIRDVRVTPASQVLVLTDEPDGALLEVLT